MKIQNPPIEDICATLVAIDLALEVLQQPLAVYDCTDAELDRSITQFKMMKVAYLLLQRHATKAVPATNAQTLQAISDSFAMCNDPSCFPCDGHPNH